MNPANAMIARCIDAVRINRCWQAELDRRPAWFKRRRLGCSLLIRAGNVFLKRSRSGITMFPRAADWIDWELRCFNLLHGDSYSCGMIDSRTAWFERLPGEPLRALLRNELVLPAIRAAGREMARAHAIASERLGGGWSHGDPHVGNMLYDAATDRARLIDFETIHDAQLSPAYRRADDLLTFLLELLAACEETHPQNDETASIAASAFLSGYGASEARESLRARLKIPSGLEWVLWQTRTRYARPQTVERWMMLLGRIL